jgi:hypothetical protein
MLRGERSMKPERAPDLNVEHILELNVATLDTQP